MDWGEINIWEWHLTGITKNARCICPHQDTPKKLSCILATQHQTHRRSNHTNTPSKPTLQRSNMQRPKTLNINCPTKRRSTFSKWSEPSYTMDMPLMLLCSQHSAPSHQHRQNHQGNSGQCKGIPWLCSITPRCSANIQCKQYDIGST